MDLVDRVALVTGSSQGIGKAIALRLAQSGAKLVINHFHMPEDAERVVGQIVAQGGQAIAVDGDVSRPEDVEQIVNQTLSAFGRVDILVNNAGITQDGLILRMSDSDWDRVIGINLKGSFLCSRAVLRPMVKQRWGRIVSLSSVVGIIGNVGQANYSASKAGIIGLTRSIAREVASRGITANAIAPGFIDTDMTRKLSDNIKQEIVKQIPLGRFGKPEDVAALVAFLSSEDAGYITGQVIPIDGGMVMA